MNSKQTETGRGRFIVFEGIDGAGKTTQIDLLEQYLRAQGKQVYRTAEPTESSTGGMLRDALSGVVKKTPCELAVLFTLDRVFHNVNPISGIEKMLTDGYDVICDRYYYSTLAYQGSETDEKWIRDMTFGCPEIRKPDICIFLDLAPEESMARIRHGRVTQEIYETKEKLTRVREQFHRVLNSLPEENIHIVNAARPVDDVQSEIRALVEG